MFGGISEKEPAKLKLYQDLISICKENSVILEILFTDVKRVNPLKDIGRDGIIAIEMANRDVDQFLFYADSSFKDSAAWLNYCDILLTIPCCVIPDVPQDNFLLQQSTKLNIKPRVFNAGTYIINFCVIKY